MNICDFYLMVCVCQQTKTRRQTQKIITMENEDERTRLENECQKRAYSNGTFFKIDLDKSKFTDLHATCQQCQKVLKGSFRNSGNLQLHLKVINIWVFIVIKK